MSLTPVLAKAFALDDLASVKSTYPKIIVQVVKAKWDSNKLGSKIRVDLTDGSQYEFTGMVDSRSDQPVELADGDVIELTHYSLTTVSHSKDPRLPLVRVFSFNRLGSNSDDAVPKPSLTRFGSNDLDNIKGKPAAPAAPAVASAAAATTTPTPTRPNPAANKAAEVSTPIEGVTPYTNGWKIRARASQKSAVRQYKTERGEGKLFNVTFVDETGEIRCTGFNEAVDKFYDLIRDGQLYYVSKCKVNPAKKQFSNVKNDFELMIQNDTEIIASSEQIDLPEVVHDFTDFAKLQETVKDANIDVIGIIKDIQEPSKITSNSTGRAYDKREISLVDRTGSVVRTTLWGQEALDFVASPDDVMAIKGARVGEFNNAKNLSTMRSSLITINPNIREAHALKGWYDAQGRNQTFKQVSTGEGDESGERKQQDVKTIKEVIDERLGHSEKPDFFSIKASVMQVYSRGLTYPACTTDGCQKKVIQETSGDWHCEKCGSTMPEPNHRYIMSMMVGDGFSAEGLRVSAFDDVGRLIMSRDASEIAALQNDENSLRPVLQSVLGQEYFFRCKTRLESYNGENSVRYQILSATPLESTLTSDTLDLLSQIEI